MSLTSVANPLACSNEMSTGIVARTHKFPSSRAGMNSPPNKGTAAKAQTNNPVAALTTLIWFSSAHRKNPRYRRCATRTSSVSSSRMGPLSSSMQSTGARVKAIMSAPLSAKP